MKNKKIIVGIAIMMVVLITLIGVTYAYFSITVIKENDNNDNTNITTADFYSVTMDLGNKIEASGALPGYKIVKPIHVIGSNNVNASNVNLTLIFTPEVSDFGSHIKYSLYGVNNSTINVNDICTASTKTNTNNKYRDTMSCNTSSLGQALISGIFNGTEEVEYNITVRYNTDITYYLLVEYLDDGDQSTEMGKSFSVSIGYEKIEEYKERLLSGADPVLKEGLIPVTISDAGVIKYANLSEKWYNYENKKWANAVILNAGVKKSEGDTLSLEDIEAMFVWVPKYSYKVWTINGNSNPQTINIKFGIEDTTDTDESCAPDGSNGGGMNCLNKYITHPAFKKFNTNGIWVGKFETGYKNAKNTSEAQNDNDNVTNIIIQPNQYSWRKIKVKNIWNVSKNYKNELNSHMMMNTEWGAASYLSHSIYGINQEVYINNCSEFKTGIGGNTVSADGSSESCANENNIWTGQYGKFASTTGNVTGIYDMNGGALEYVAGVLAGYQGQAGFSSLDIINNNRSYFDLYNTNNISSRILGDSIEETYNWYSDCHVFVNSDNPWIRRGGHYKDNVTNGVFCFYFDLGDGNYNGTFRVVLSF